jgi:hypothetical protein
MIRRWIALLFVLSALFAGGTAMSQSVMERLVMPGPLTNSHAKLEGNCAACHESFSKPAQDRKCLGCHKGIAGDVASGVGFHGKSSARGMQCKACHSDHHGRGFKLVQFNPATFNHNLTNYPLTGGHARAKCLGCHGGNRHFRGTPQACASCHAKKDPHFGRLGRSCQSCHTTADWKRQLPFNHAKTGFGLVGKHGALGCLTCHAGQRWAGTPRACIGCHAKKDVHRGSRGTNCASCHTPKSWAAATFNHNRDTGFPLVGRHGQTACAGCHGAGNSIRKPPRTCYGCHAKNDVHKGSRGTNCASCHAPTSWKTASFNHNRDTDFPLIGKHASTTCAGCHGAGNARPHPPKTCYGCHASDDKHKGTNGTDCAKCHNSADWKQSKFDHNTMTRFPLKGAHQPLECAACHKRPASEVKPPIACVGCHVDDDAHDGSFGADCESCHNVVAWKDKVKFDHDLTRFPLIGKHAPLECAKCHVDKSFKAKGVTCQSCHADEHHAGTLGVAPSCAKCHNSSDWKMWRFDHDTATQFPLAGKHKGLICTACHAKPGDPHLQATACISCHQRDDVHKGNFGTNCEKCHTTNDFTEIIMQNQQ